MKKGYPASEYYGPPPPVLNEGGVARPIAVAEPSRVESRVTKLVAGADPSRAERRGALKESFINKINI
jgi:hypothetical protein